MFAAVKRPINLLLNPLIVEGFVWVPEVNEDILERDEEDQELKESEEKEEMSFMEDLKNNCYIPTMRSKFTISYFMS